MIQVKYYCDQCHSRVYRSRSGKFLHACGQVTAESLSNKIDAFIADLERRGEYLNAVKYVSIRQSMENDEEACAC